MDLYPILPGLSFSKIRRPIGGNTIVQTAASGKQVRFALQSRPRWEYELHYDVLRANRGRGVPMRGQYDNLAQVPNLSRLWNESTLVENELSVLEGFFLRQQGQFAEWYFDDYNDDMVGLYLFGVGDGQTQSWQTYYDSDWQAEYGGQHGLAWSLWTDSSPYGPRSVNSFAQLTPALGWGMDATGLITTTSPPLTGQPLYITAQTGSQQGATREGGAVGGGSDAAAQAYFYAPLLGEVFATAPGGDVTTFQLVRQIGSTAAGYQEPITEINGVAGIWDNGLLADPAHYTVTLDNSSGNGGQVTFNYPPTAGHVLTWAGKYYFRCIFKEDMMEFEEFAAKLFRAKQVEFTTVL